jgi:hypothetical protein
MYRTDGYFARLTELKSTGGTHASEGFDKMQHNWLCKIDWSCNQYGIIRLTKPLSVQLLWLKNFEEVLLASTVESDEPGVLECSSVFWLSITHRKQFNTGIRSIRCAITPQITLLATSKEISFIQIRLGISSKEQVCESSSSYRLSYLPNARVMISKHVLHSIQPYCAISRRIMELFRNFATWWSESIWGWCALELPAIHLHIRPRSLCPISTDSFGEPPPNMFWRSRRSHPSISSTKTGPAVHSHNTAALAELAWTKNIVQILEFHLVKWMAITNLTKSERQIWRCHINDAFELDAITHESPAVIHEKAAHNDITPPLTLVGSPRNVHRQIILKSSLLLQLSD